MGKKYLIFMVAITLLGIAAIAWAISRRPDADRIFTNTYIHGVPVGGMSLVEAEAALMEHFQPALEGQTLQYTINGEAVAEFTFADFGARFNFIPLVQEAMSHRGLRNLWLSHSITEPPGFTVTPERVQSIFAGLSRQVDVEPQNAGFKLQDSKIVVTAEKDGRSLDIQALSLATEQVLAGFESGVVEIILHTISPEYTKSAFDFTVSVLGSFRTKYDGDDSCPRVYNVRLASERISNRVLFPGEVFSAGEHIAAHLPNSGYKAAIVLVKGEPVEDVGGGVCQVVSTLYNAALAAELQIIQRHNHSAPVSYVEKGFDATVAGDYFDLKFKNDTAHPILIVSQMKNGELIITIHGYESRPAGRSIRFSAHKVEVVPPGDYREIVDATVPLGERHVISESQMGYSIELRKHVYIDGKEVEVIKINTSVYKPLQGVIAIGAG